MLFSILRLLISIGDLPAASIVHERIIAHPLATATERGMAHGCMAVGAGDNKAAEHAFSGVSRARDGHGDGLVVSASSLVSPALGLLLTQLSFGLLSRSGGQRIVCCRPVSE